MIGSCLCTSISTQAPQIRHEPIIFGLRSTSIPAQQATMALTPKSNGLFQGQKVKFRIQTFFSGQVISIGNNFFIKNVFEIPPQCIGGEFQHGYNQAQSSPCKHKNKNVLMFQDQPFQRRSALPRKYQSGTIKCRSAPIGANYFIECAAAKRLTMGAALPIGHQTLDFSDTSPIWLGNHRKNDGQ